MRRQWCERLLIRQPSEGLEGRVACWPATNASAARFHRYPEHKMIGAPNSAALLTLMHRAAMHAQPGQRARVRVPWDK